MRHYVAVQAEDGKWFYANEGRSRKTGEYGWTPSGACSARMACPACKAADRSPLTLECAACETCNGEYMIANPSPCPGHDTKEEAYEHERQRMLATVRFNPDLENPRSAHRCKADGCSTLTSGSARIGSWFHPHLCADHRNMETVDKLFHVGESWES